MRTLAFAISLLALAAPRGFGESKDCLNPDVIVPDGRIVQSQFEGSDNGSNPAYFYTFYGQAGHSYSVEFVATTDNENNGRAIRFFNFVIWAPADKLAACTGNSSLTTVDTRKYSPALARDSYGTGRRLAFVQPTSGFDLLTIANSAGAGEYSYRVSDTTLFTPRWSTYSGFDSQWGFMNMSDMTVDGTFNVYDSGNRLLASTQVSIPAGGEVFRYSSSSDLNLPRDRVGYAYFAHTGPPRAILADSYMLNSAGTVIIFSKFETRYPD